MNKIHKVILLILTTIFVMSCNDTSNDNFVLNGYVKGLKKGTVYLQKDGKRTIINLDSVVVNGESNFTLSTNINEPILLYLKLQKKDGNDHYIPFFANKGITEINTSLKTFTNAEIKGSKQQQTLKEYLDLMADFRKENLNLIEANFEASKAKDSLAVDSIAKRSNRLIKLKYASTINFALKNNNSEVAPYLALYEIPNASPKFLDSIYKNLSPDIKTSLYGKRLGNALADFKKSQDSIQ